MYNRTRFLPALAFGLSLAAMPASAANEPAKPGVPDSEKVVCKRIAETGSLVKKTKVCLTRDQWTRSADKHEGYARDLADGLRTKPAGN